MDCTQRDVSEYKVEMIRLRERFEAIDGEVVRLIQERLDLSIRMAYLKHALNLPTEDLAREAAIVKRVENGVDNPVLSGAVVSVFKSILKESKAVQEEIRRKL